MWIYQRHQRQKAVVGDAEDADLAVAFGDVLHQPINRVVGVGSMIDRRRILRSMQRTIHDIVALGTVLAAYVLDHADVAALDNYFDGIVIAAENWAKMRTLRVAGKSGGIVGRTR